MSVTGFNVEGTIQKYDYGALDNKAVARSDILDSAFVNFAPVYDSTKTYAYRSYVFRNGVLYRSNTDITTPEAWTASHWTSVILSNDLRTILTVFARAADLTPTEFSESNTYALNDYVYRNNLLYRCTVPVTTPGAWDSTHWTRVYVGTELNGIRNSINKIIFNTALDYDPNSTYSVYDYVLYNGYLYRCSEAITTPEAWNSAHWTLAHIGTDLKTIFNNFNRSANVAGEFSESNTYALNDYVYHNYLLYRCTVPVTTPGAWDSANWTRAYVGNDLKTILNNFDHTEFSESNTYALNDYVYHNYLLYRCTVPVTTPGAWDSTHWTRVYVGTELNGIRNSINKIIFNTALDYDPNSTYSVYDYVLYNGYLYRCSEAITTPEAWNSAHWTLAHIGTDLKTIFNNFNRSANVAGEFSESNTYALNDYVYHNYLLYRCTVPVTTPGAWDSANWIRAYVGTELNGIRNSINKIIFNTALDYDPNSTYSVYDYVLYNGYLYRCREAITTPEAWNSAHWTLAHIGTDLKTIFNNFNRSANVAGEFSESNTYALNDYVYHNYLLYRCTVPVTTPGAWDSTHWTRAYVGIELKRIRSDFSAPSAGSHNSLYRGKNITGYLEDGSLWARINGNAPYEVFEDLYIGDYISITKNGVTTKYCIVDFDYFKNVGADPKMTRRHIVMMPESNLDLTGYISAGLLITSANAGVTVSSQETLHSFKWNGTLQDPNNNSTVGGYIASRLRNVIMPACVSMIKDAFGNDHVPKLDAYYPVGFESTTSGVASAVGASGNGATFEPLECDIPNEIMIAGTSVWSQKGEEIGLEKRQLAYFRLNSSVVAGSYAYWLRTVYSSSLVGMCDQNGSINKSSVATVRGIRPRFVLVG